MTIFYLLVQMGPYDNFYLLVQMGPYDNFLFARANGTI